MSIFVEIGKQFLSKAINEAIHFSFDADSSIINAALRIMAWPRDEDLGRAKRVLLSELEHELKQFNPSGSDEYSLHEFHKLIRTYKTRLASLAQERQLDEGKTGMALSGASDLVQSIFNEIEKLQLLNLPRDKKLLSIFQYYICKYFATKLFNEQRLNLVQGLTEQPSISTFRKRAQERGELITQSLNQCMEDLDVLDKKDPKYNNAIKRMVTINIDALLRNEQTLHDKYKTVGDTLRLLLSTFGVVKDDSELLNELMQEALREIQLIAQGKDQLNLNEWINPDEEQHYQQETRQRIEKELALARAEMEARETIARKLIDTKEAETFHAFMTDFLKKVDRPLPPAPVETTQHENEHDFDDADEDDDNAMIADTTNANFHRS